LGKREARRAVRDQRAGLGRALLALPDLGLAQLIHPGALGGHEVVAHEHRAHTLLARGGQESHDVAKNTVSVGDLREDPGLHVVDDERERCGIEGFVQRLGDGEPMEAVHRPDATSTLARSAESGGSRPSDSRPSRKWIGHRDRVLDAAVGGLTAALPRVRSTASRTELTGEAL
jgi:hypothetical protein